MSWLTNFVRPKLQALVNKKEVPDNLWTRCPNCEQMLFHKDLEESLHVCRHCQHHLRLPADKRLEYLCDEGKFTLHPTPEVPRDPLKFKDLKKYSDRLKSTQEKMNQKDAILIATGKIKNQKVVIAAFDFYFMGGSMGCAVGEALIEAANLAVSKKLPLLVVPASGGARMQEGILSLMQMPRTVMAISRVKQARLPYLVLLSDPTTGGVSASFAMLGDIHLAEPNTLIGFTGARVIQQTIREELPEGFQKSEYLQKHGMVDMVVERKKLPEEIGRLLNLLMVKKI